MALSGGGHALIQREKLQVVISDAKHVPPSSTFSLSWEIRETGKKRDK